MKKVIIINGPMGVGKTTVSKILCNKLSKSAFLDGDWCFDLHPFIANKETKEMAIRNITYLIKNYLNCSECEYVVFNWVMDNEFVYENILNNLSDMNYQLIKITLTCKEEALEDRWYKDKVNDWRIQEWLDVSKRSLQYFEQRDTIKIDTSNISPENVVDVIYDIIRG
ncbi:MAG: nucleotide kinase [Herbinix sp.]|jgi:broad-specificity NMP kinase|nr:nucleotide kinase [Herbinix sp.]